MQIISINKPITQKPKGVMVNSILRTAALAAFLVLGSLNGWGQGTESFANIPTASSTSYSTRSWTGDNGATWGATDARTDQTITTKAITVRNGALTFGLSSAQQSAGIGSLTLSAKAPFGSPDVGTLQLVVNGTTISSKTTTGSTTSSVVSYTWSAINVSTLTSIVINQTTSGARITIDDVSWTAAPVACTAPTTQASAITFPSIGTATLDVNWTNGNGAGRVVKMNSTNSFTAPTNGSNPSASTTWANSGEQVVFNGTGSGPVTINGLASSTTYYFRVYEYCSPDRVYQTAAATNNPNNQATNASGSPTLSTGALSSGFGSVCVNTLAGTNPNFTITGSNLTSTALSVSGNAAYTFATSAGGSYSNPLNLGNNTCAGTNCYTQTVYVRFTPTSAITYDGNFTVSGGGASDATVAVTGSGTGGTVSVTTASPTGNSTVSVDAGGTSLNTSCGTITAKGIVWGVSANPTVPSVSSTNDGTGTANYSSTATGLTANTLYNYRAYATNSNGVTAYGSNLLFTTLSLPPTSPTASAATQNGFTASWTAPTGQGSATYTYTVEVYDNSSFSGSPVTTVSSLSSTSTIITGLSSSTTYYFRVRINNAGGNSSFANYTTGITTTAGPIWINPITDTDPSTANPYTAGETVAGNITVSGIGRGSGISAATASNRYAASGWTTGTSVDLNDYFYFTITPSSGYEVDLSNFIYTGQASGSGPTSFAIRSSIDGYTANIGSPNVSGTTIDLSGASYQNLTSAVTFRLYGWNSSGGAGTFSVNSFEFNGTISAVVCTGTPGNPTAITVSPSSSSSLCAGYSSSGITLSLSGTVPTFSTYKWQYSTTSGSGFSDIIGATSATYTIPTGLTGSSNYYRCVVTCGGNSANSSESQITINAIPSAPGTPTGSTSVCPSATGNVYTVTNVAGTTYNWTVSGTGWSIPVSSTTNSVTVTSGTVAGTVSVTATKDGCTSSASQLTGISLLSQPTFSPASPALCANGSNLGVTVSVATGGSFGAGSGTATGVSLSGTDPTYTIAPGSVSGTRNFTYTAANGCSKVLTVTVNALPTSPTFTTATSTNNVANICDNSTGLTYQATGGSTYNWTFPLGWAYTGGTGATATITTIGASGSVSVTNTSGGCTSTPNTISVTVNAAPAQPSVISGPTSVCASTTGLVYTVTNTSGLTYNWSISGSGWSIPVSSTTNSVTVSSGSFANGNITVTSTNGTCTSTARTLTGITVNDPVPAYVRISSSNANVCASVSQTFTAYPTNAGTSPTYQWKVNGTNVGTGNTYTGTLNEGDNIWVVMTVGSDACASNSTATSNLLKGRKLSYNRTPEWTETFGTGTSTQAANYTGYSSISNSNITVGPTSYDVDIRNTTVSPSGGSNLFFTGTGGGAARVLTISNINTTSVYPNKLVFEFYKAGSVTYVDSSNFLIEVSTDGTNFFPVSYPQFSGSARWDSIVLENVLPKASNVRLRFTSDIGGSSTPRIDNMRLFKYSTSDADVDASGPLNFCAGSNVTLAANPASGTTLTYAWTGGSTANNITVSTAGTYSVTITDAFGCSSSASKTTSVLPNTTYYQDSDNDGYGNPSVTQISCTGAPVGYVANNTDCNDNSALLTTNCATPFVTVWNLAQTGSGATQISFGVGTTGTVNYFWEQTVGGSATGSGTFSGSTATITGLPAMGTIRLYILPTNFKRFNMNASTDWNRLMEVSQWGTTAWNSMQFAFQACLSLEVTATDIPNLSGVTNSSSMFEGCTSLTGPTNINSWNVGNITNMQQMFNGAIVFNQPLNSWNTSNVQNMFAMFAGALQFNQPIGNWNTSSVTDMGNMFANNDPDVFNQPLNNWNTSSVENMSGMFSGADAFNQPLSNWNLSSCITINGMFYGAAVFNQPINSWNTANVQDMQNVFTYATNFNQPLHNWNLSSAVAANGMFDFSGMDCDNYTTTLNGWAANSATASTITFGANGVQYGTNGQTAHDYLENAKAWQITGDVAGASACGSSNFTVGSTYTWLGNTTQWTAGGNWSTGVAPSTCSHDVVIPSVPSGGNFPTIGLVSPTIGNLQIQNGARITANNVLKVCGNVTGGNNPLNLPAIIGSSYIELNGTSGTQQISGQVQFTTIRLNNTDGAQLASGAAVDIVTSLQLKDGAFTTTGGTLRFKSGAPDEYAILDNFSDNTWTGTLVGSATSERYVPVLGNNQHYLGTPVTGATFTQLGGSGTAGYLIPKPTCDQTQMANNSPYGNVFQWHDNDPDIIANNCLFYGWEVKKTGPTEAGRGYSVYLNQGTFSITGPINQGTTYTVGGCDNIGWTNNTLQTAGMIPAAYESGWHIVANPFQAPIELSGHTPTFDDAAIWVTSGPYNGTYQPLSITGGTVAPFQGFIVHRNGTSAANFVFSKSECVTTQGINYYKTASEHQLNVNVSGNSFADVTYVEYNSDATNAFDVNYDSRKPLSKLGQPTLFTFNTNPNSRLSRNINRTISETPNVPMSFVPGADGQFTITVDGINTFDPTTYIFLEDKKTGTWTDMRANATYTFQSVGTDAHDRFVLHFTPAAIINTTAATCETNGTLYLEQPGTASWNYTITNSQSATINAGVLNNSNSTVLGVPAGIYTITMVDNSGYTVVKAVTVSGNSATTAVLSSSAQTVEEGQTVNFTNSTAGTTTAEWDMGDGTVFSNQPTVAYQYTQPGVYTVTLTVTNTDGCVSTTSQLITVTEATATGILTLTGNGVNIFSFNNTVVVDFGKAKNVDATIDIYNLLGQKLTSEKTAGNVYAKNISDISAAYVIVRVNNNGVESRKKVFLSGE